VVSFLVRRSLKYWLPVVGWMLFIFVGSTDLMSADHTSRFIGPFFRWFAPDISEPTVATIQLFIRKCAHFTEYAILAILLCRALRLYRDRVFAVSFLAAAVYSALDEVHQSFVSSRTGSPWDLAIDCVGALSGLVLCSLFRIRRSKIGNRK
jgi:VanZ family protein